MKLLPWLPFSEKNKTEKHFNPIKQVFLRFNKARFMQVCIFPHLDYLNEKILLVKFGFSEKATKFEKNLCRTFDDRSVIAELCKCDFIICH